MAALLKDVYTKEYIEHLASTVSKRYPPFNKTEFIDAIFDKDWQHKELKARTLHVAE